MSTPYDDEKELHKDTVHEENKKEEREMKDHENDNPDLGKGRNPIHHNAGGK